MPRRNFVISGYRDVSSAERASFGVLSSLAITIFVARAISYQYERQGQLPRTRARLRQISTWPPIGGKRVHHFVPGVALALAAGASAIVTRTHGSELRFGVPFGVGAGMTTDEIALLIRSDNPYWRSGRFAFLQAAVAALGAAALGLRFGLRGRKLELASS